MTDDAELLRRYAATHDQAAFAELVRRHLNLVYSVALRQVGGDAHLAEDIAQGVFFDLARKAESLARRPVLAGWLYRAAQFAASDLVRSERRRRAREQEAQVMDEIVRQAEAEPDWDRLRPVLDQLVGGLSERDRDAVLLRFFEERPFAEIGVRLQLSEGGARMRVERALDRLRGELSRRGVTSTSAALAAALAGQAATAAPVGLADTVTGLALGAGVGPAATGSLLNLMSTTKITLTAAGLIVALAIGTSLHERRASRAMEAELLESNRQSAGMLERLGDLKQRAASAEAGATDLQKSIDAAKIARVGAQDSATAETAPATLDPTIEGRAFLSRHPEVRQALSDRARARVAGRYGPYYKSWGWSSAQIERFENLMIEGEGINVGGPKGQMSLLPGTGISRDELDSRVHDLLGDAGYQQYQDATRLIPLRQAMLKLASAVYFTDTPLTIQQIDQLTQVAVETQKNSPSGRYDLNAIVAKSGDILLPTQQAALAGFREQDLYNKALGQAMRSSPTPPTMGLDGKPAK